MFELNGKEFELKYNLKRVELIEASTGEPLMAALQKYKGMLSLQHLKIYGALAMKEAGADAFVAPKEEQAYMETLIERDGYENVAVAVLEALQRDCPFFFPAA